MTDPTPEFTPARRQYRRFARCFEFDRNGPPLEGSPEQQAAIRASLARYAPFDSPLDQTLFKVDVAVNLKGRRFTPISFVDFTNENWLGFTGPSNIQLHDGLHADSLEPIFFHELGHLIGWHTPAWAGRFCDPAWEFADWVVTGQDQNSPVWQRIETA